MKKTFTLSLLLLVALYGFGANSAINHATFAVKDVYQTAHFLKNVPGLINDCDGQPIRYFASHEGTTVYLTDAGPIYKVRKIDRKKIEEEKRERLREMRHGQDADADGPVPFTTPVSYTRVLWAGANPHPVIEEVGRSTGYFTYLAGHDASDMHSIETYGYSKLIYHDLYPGIDVEYSFPEGGGVKYDIIIHPGADPSQVQMDYTGAAQRITTDRSGNMTVHTTTGDILEHTPVSFTADRSPVASAYSIQGLHVSFSTPAGYDHSKVLTIDPWVDVLSQLTVRNLGADVDYDVPGNLYVYGAGSSDALDTFNLNKIAKYDPTGVNLWVFMGTVSSISWSTAQGSGFDVLANAKIDRTSSKVYVGQFDFNGTRVIRLNSLGVYDNFVSQQDTDFREVWSFVANCNTGSVLALGGGTGSNINMGIVNPTTGHVNITNFTGVAGYTGQDVVSGAYDSAGYLYVVMASTTPGTTVNNKLFKVNTSYTGTVWGLVATGYTAFTEVQNMPAYDNLTGVNSNNFNAIAANGSYLYYYDGKHLKAFNLATGAAVGTALTLAGSRALTQGGIAVDRCNNVYIGGKGAIDVYSFNGTTFTAGTPISLGAGFTTDTVFDVRYNSNSNLLFIAGTSIVGTYTATPSTTCIVSYNYSDSVTANCLNAKVVVTPGVGLFNPSYSYVWKDSIGNIIRQTVSDTVLVDSFTAPYGGRFTVTIDLNVNCGGASLIDTFNIIPCNSLTSGDDTTICAGQSAALWAIGLAAGGTYLWTPGNATTPNITVSPGTTTIYTVKYTPPVGAPLFAYDTVTVTPAATTAVTVSNPTICAGQTATLSDSSNIPGGTWHWSPGNATTQSITVTPATTTTYTVTYSTAHCGSPTATGTVTIAAANITPVSQTICAGGSYTFGTQTLTTAGTYMDTLSSQGGCDSIIVLTLTVAPVPAAAVSQAICAGSSYTFGSQTVNAAGSYSDTLTTASGCDSIVVLTLTVSPAFNTPINEQICNGSTYNFYGQTLSTSGTYADTLTSAGGCDSIITLTLSVVSVIHASIAQSICSTDSFSFHGQYLHTAGTYLDSTTSAGGCDSITTLTLTVVQPVTTPVAQSICSGDSYTFFGQTLTTSGTYIDTTQSVVTGCDSIVVLTLTVLPTSSATISQTICSGTTFAFGNSTLTAAGTYMDTFQNTVGCDSFTTLTLTVLSTSYDSNAATICGGGTYMFDGQTLSTTGIYRDTMTNSTGCDSFNVLSLTVLPRPVASFSVEPASNIVAVGSVITVTDQSSNADSVLWILNSKVVTLLSDGQVPISDTGTYCIRLVASSAIGCSDTSMECITVYNNSFYMPNAFTPNGNGVNDYIALFGSRDGMKKLAISVWDRWGERVYESTDLDFQWDGTYRGQKEEPGLYVYTLDITFASGYEVHNKGSITLIR